MFIILIILISLGAVYQAIPSKWQPAAIAGVLTLFAMALILTTIRVVREMVVFSERPGLPVSFVWRDPQTADDFQLAFLGYLRKKGWDVLLSRLVDGERVAFIVQRRRQCIVLLCLAADAHIRDEDYRQTALWQSEFQADDAAIVTAHDYTVPGYAIKDLTARDRAASMPAAPAGRLVKTVRYDRLQTLHVLPL
jgi:hypothetical protein